MKINMTLFPNLIILNEGKLYKNNNLKIDQNRTELF
jgi:hypothetical protein